MISSPRNRQQSDSQRHKAAWRQPGGWGEGRGGEGGASAFNGLGWLEGRVPQTDGGDDGPTTSTYPTPPHCSTLTVEVPENGVKWLILRCV